MGIYDLKNNKYLFSPVVSFSCRKLTGYISVKTFKFQIGLYQKLFNFIRIALHPCDIESEKKVSLIKETLLELKKWGNPLHLNHILGGKDDKSRLASTFSGI